MCLDLHLGWGWAWRCGAGLGPPSGCFAGRSGAAFVDLLWFFSLVFAVPLSASVCVCLVVAYWGWGWPLGSRLWCLAVGL